MSRNSIMAQQAIDFSVCLINYYRWLCSEKKEFVLSRQILRSGTSIGANIHEAIYASSAADFASKMQISLKEASETEYWFQILETTDLLPEEFLELKESNKELIRMLIQTLNTVKTRMASAKLKKP